MPLPQVKKILVTLVSRNPFNLLIFEEAFVMAYCDSIGVKVENREDVVASELSFGEFDSFLKIYSL